LAKSAHNATIVRLRVIVLPPLREYGAPAWPTIEGAPKRRAGRRIRWTFEPAPHPFARCGGLETVSPENRHVNGRVRGCASLCARTTPRERGSNRRRSHIECPSLVRSTLPPGDPPADSNRRTSSLRAAHGEGSADRGPIGAHETRKI